MQFDIFFSICQTDVDGYMPSEKVMLENFFDQIKLADELGFGTAWVAETHLSCETQKQNADAVIPHFKGEIGLNTDILQIAHKVFAQTKRINIGSAIRNILCNGGPLAHAEAIKMFLSLHGLDPKEKRFIDIGFATGRFPFSNIPYGIIPRTKTEEAAWPVIKGKILQEATEIFLRALKSQVFSSKDITKKKIKSSDFRSADEWKKVVAIYQEEAKTSEPIESIEIAPFWTFDKVGVIPFEPRLDLLRLTVGTHDVETQILANKFFPCGVFNLSITPPAVIEETHKRMQTQYHPSGGGWQRSNMPRTAMVFLDQTTDKARATAKRAWENYWRAMEGTLDVKKVENAVSNAIAGDVQTVIKQIREKYHRDDRLMLWFDFNNHDNEIIKSMMRNFMQHVAPELR